MNKKGCQCLLLYDYFFQHFFVLVYAIAVMSTRGLYFIGK